MKGTNREVVICDVQVGTERDFKVMGESTAHASLVQDSLAATQGHLLGIGWQKVGTSKTYNGRLVDVWKNGQMRELIAVYESVCWALWVDIEGFSSLYRDATGSKAIWGLHGLMKDLYRIGHHVYPGEGERLFIHQAGDGFIMESDFGDMDLLRPLAIGTALLRAALMRGRCLKIGIGLGTLADVKGCYPRELMENFEDGGVSIGAGIMTIFPVMGEGLVDAHSVSGKASGPLLITRRDLLDTIPDEGLPKIVYREHIEIDWIHADFPEAERIQDKLGCKGNPATYATQLRSYVDADGNKSLPDPWRKSAELLIRGY